jgi:hypothetical protein
MECWFHLLLESCCFLSNLIRCKAGGWQSHLMIVLGERMASVDALHAEADESKHLQAEPTAEWTPHFRPSLIAFSKENHEF